MSKGAKRPVYVNGAYCESMAAGAKHSSVILGRAVQLYQIQRILDGRLTIKGLAVTDKPAREKPGRAERTGPRALIRYPPGRRPMEEGLPPQWR